MNKSAISSNFVALPQDVQTAEAVVQNGLAAQIACIAACAVFDKQFDDSEMVGRAGVSVRGHAVQVSHNRKENGGLS